MGFKVLSHYGVGILCISNEEMRCKHAASLSAEKHFLGGNIINTPHYKAQKNILFGENVINTPLDDKLHFKNLIVTVRVLVASRR